MFSSEERTLYSRHFMLNNFGEAAQTKLKQSKVLVVGTGGLSCPALQYFAAAGIGTIGIIDGDVVELSNLQRQILFNQNHIGQNKALIAKQVLSELNPFIQIQAYPEFLTTENALDIIRHYDLVFDGTDTFQTRYLICDSTYILRKAHVYGSLDQYKGQFAIFNSQFHTSSINYRDVFPEPPQAGSVLSCGESGVLGILAGIIGNFMALQTIQLLSQEAQYKFPNQFNSWDANSMQFKQFTALQDPENTLRRHSPEETRLLVDYAAFCGNTTVPEISAKDFLQTQSDAYFLLDVREEWEFQISNLGGYLIPLNQLQSRISELPENTPIYAHCKSGKRSITALQILKAARPNQVCYTIQGGIEAILQQKTEIQL